MPPYMEALMISYRHYDRMHSPTRPEQHQNRFLLATSSGSPSAPLKIIQHSWPIKNLPLHSNLNHFRHVGVNGTQSTSQTLFPMQKKEFDDLILGENTCPRKNLNILFPEALFIRALARILLEYLRGKRETYWKRLEL